MRWKPRAYSAGERAARGRPSSKVRVYERRDIGRDRFFCSCAWIQTPSGRPEEVALPVGTTWEAARNFADDTAAQRKRAILAGRNAFGQEEKPIVTIGRLFDEYMASEVAKSWGRYHARDVKYSIALFRKNLDMDAEVMSLSPALVTGIVGEAARAHPRNVGARWIRKRLANIRAAVLWGRDKAHLFDVNPLRGMEMPEYEPETDELIYSPAEARKLWAPHEEVDWRVTLLANVVTDNGRRLTATLALTTEDILTDGKQIFLRYRKEYDKTKKTALAPVSSHTAALLADALERDLVQEWGWLFPEGRLDFNDPRDKPWGDWAAINALHEAEETLKIPTIYLRAYHGLKRRHVTASMEVSHGDTALVGDVTGNVSADLLRRVYRKANRRRTATHVEAVREHIQTDETSHELTQLGGARPTGGTPEKADESARESTRDPEAE